MRALMGTPKPVDLIGGIADCLRAEDVTTYVDAAKTLGSTGGSLYDFLTTQANSEQGTFWQVLGRLNG
jgi:hypothetical protein